MAIPLTWWFVMRRDAALRGQWCLRTSEPRDADIDPTNLRERRWPEAIRRCTLGSWRRFTLREPIRPDEPSRAAALEGFCFAAAGLAMKPWIAGERSSVMRFERSNPFRMRPTVAGAVETMVTMGMTVAVSVFFVAMVVFPHVFQVQAA